MDGQGVLHSNIHQLPGLYATKGSELFEEYATRLRLKQLSLTSSAEGAATCLEGYLPIAAEATNFVITASVPANQLETTQMFVEMMQTGGTHYATAFGGTDTVSGTYDIFSKLCVPEKLNATSSIRTLQILTHGGTMDYNYWDLAPGYSYVDAAAEAGYATFSYDRLGTGKSDHPDPLQVVQVPLQVEILHQMVQGLKASCSAVSACRDIVGVGHSADSTIMQGLTTKYPEDYDAIILTGTSTSLDSMNVATAGFAKGSANTDPSGRFSDLPNAYFMQGAVLQAVQFSFWRYPNFDAKIMELAFDIRQTNTLGELLSLGSAFTPSTEYTGPVGVMDGENDCVFCGRDCSHPVNQAQPVIDVFYPAANKSGSKTYLQPGAGHHLALHLNAKDGFDQMISFLQENDFS